MYLNDLLQSILVEYCLVFSKSWVRLSAIFPLCLFISCTVALTDCPNGHFSQMCMELFPSMNKYSSDLLSYLFLNDTHIILFSTWCYSLNICSGVTTYPIYMLNSHVKFIPFAQISHFESHVVVNHLIYPSMAIKETYKQHSIHQSQLQ